MQREQRYMIFKGSDIDKYCTEEQKIGLLSVSNMIHTGRHRDGKEPFDAVVVEHDWEEYEKVWDMIEKRVDSIANTAGE